MSFYAASGHVALLLQDVESMRQDLATYAADYKAEQDKVVCEAFFGICCTPLLTCMCILLPSLAVRHMQ